MGTKEENKRYYEKNKAKLRVQANAKYRKKRREILDRQKKRRESDLEYRAVQNERMLDYYYRNRAEILKKAQERRDNMTEAQRDARKQYMRDYRIRLNQSANS